MKFLQDPYGTSEVVVFIIRNLQTSSVHPGLAGILDRYRTYAIMHAQYLWYFRQQLIYPCVHPILMESGSTVHVGPTKQTKWSSGMDFEPTTLRTRQPKWQQGLNEYATRYWMFPRILPIDELDPKYHLLSFVKHVSLPLFVYALLLRISAREGVDRQTGFSLLHR